MVTRSVPLLLANTTQNLAVDVIPKNSKNAQKDSEVTVVYLPAISSIRKNTIFEKYKTENSDKQPPISPR